MGNRKRIKKTASDIVLDTANIAGTSIAIDDLEIAATKAVSNFGVPNTIFIGTNFFMDQDNPYAHYRLTKTMRSFSKFHRLMRDLGMLRKVDHMEIARACVHNTTKIKRKINRRKWREKRKANQAYRDAKV